MEAETETWISAPAKSRISHQIHHNERCARFAMLWFFILCVAHRLFNSPQVSNSPLVSKRSTTHQLRHIFILFSLSSLLVCLRPLNLTLKYNQISLFMLLHAQKQNERVNIEFFHRKMEDITSWCCLFYFSVFFFFSLNSSTHSHGIEGKLLMILLLRFTLLARTPNSLSLFIFLAFQIFHFPTKQAKMAMILIKQASKKRKVFFNLPRLLHNSTRLDFNGMRIKLKSKRKIYNFKVIYIRSFERRMKQRN